MKVKLLVVILLWTGLASAQSPSGLLLSTVIKDVTTATYAANLLFAGLVIHATANTAYAVVYDGSTEIFRWSVATSGNSGGWVFAQGGYSCATSIRVDLVNCIATLYRRYR